MCLEGSKRMKKSFSENMWSSEILTGHPTKVWRYHYSDLLGPMLDQQQP
jgi:hypothetical protein